MRLGELISGLSATVSRIDPELEIGDIAYDSRQVRPGFLFVALRGHQQDGHRYLLEAAKRGAAAVVAEDLRTMEGRPLSVIQVTDSRKALAELARRFFGRPFDGVNLVGITGTSGKTTTAFLIESILNAAGAKPGVIGTIDYHFGGRTWPALNTTPESLDLMRLMRDMRKQGASDVIMEVSSHALEQGRVEGCPFRVAVFTNLTRDHLDYHETMEKYFRAKSLLFCSLGVTEGSNPRTAVINVDDPRGADLARLTRARVLTYGLKEECDLSARHLRLERDGLHFTLKTPLGEQAVHSSLLGQGNVYNILAAAGAALALEVNPAMIAKGIEELKVVPGRMEHVANAAGLTIIVDYAHKPEALLNALRFLRPFTRGRLFTVFGCGGDRDRGKRPEMGRIAAEESDFVIITSDNPRHEEPLEIMRQIEKGTAGAGLKKITADEIGKQTSRGFYILEADRRRAIRLAVKALNADDVLLIAGKGHEDYQIILGRKQHFDDRQEAVLAVAEGR